MDHASADLLHDVRVMLEDIPYDVRKIIIDDVHRHRPSLVCLPDEVLCIVCSKLRGVDRMSFTTAFLVNDSLHKRYPGLARISYMEASVLSIESEIKMFANKLFYALPQSAMTTILIGADWSPFARAPLKCLSQLYWTNYPPYINIVMNDAAIRSKASRNLAQGALTIKLVAYHTIAIPIIEYMSSALVFDHMIPISSAIVDMRCMLLDVGTARTSLVTSHLSSHARQA